MLEVVLPPTKVQFDIDEHTYTVVDVVEITWLVDQWHEELTDLSERERDVVIRQRICEKLNETVDGANPRPLTESEATAFLMGLPAVVDEVKKKLAAPQILSPSTDTTSSQNAQGNYPFCGSSSTTLPPGVSAFNGNQPHPSPEKP